MYYFVREVYQNKRVGCKAGSPSWAPPSSEQFPPPWERGLNGLLFVTFCAVPLKFNKHYVIKKLADIFVLSFFRYWPRSYMYLSITPLIHFIKLMNT